MDNTYVMMFAAINKMQQRPSEGYSFINLDTTEGRVEIQMFTMVGAGGRAMVLNPRNNQYVGIVHHMGTTYYWAARGFNITKLKYV